MEFILNTASEEQRKAILDYEESHILVDSVAGSGKTTLSLHIAKHYESDRILLLTYNAKLKLETRQKVEWLGIQNMEIHSYHSFCVKYYNHQCFTDSGIIQLLKSEEIKPLRKFHFERIILDECQDMSPLYYSLVQLILKHNANPLIKICVMGDKHQSIYQFNKADERYITMADALYPHVKGIWKENRLQQSFRITHEMAQMLNHVFLGEDRITSVKRNEKPTYLICDAFGESMGSSNRVYKEVVKYMKEGYSFSDIFILAPSVKSDKSPVRQLANKLSDEGVPIFVPTSDEAKLDEDILKGKIVFSTFHQSKGLERKVVIVFGIDASYFELFKKDSNPDICPNEIYVALTRASEKMTMIHHYQNDYFPFVKKHLIEEFCQMEKSRIHKTNTKKKMNVKTNVTDLIKHLPIEVIHQAMGFIDQIPIQDKDKLIDIPLKTKQKNLYEGVSEITGIAIPTYYELKQTGKMTIFDRCKNAMQDVEEASLSRKSLFDEMESKKEEEDDLIKLKKIDLTKLKTSELLYIANLWNSSKTGFIYKVNQIQKYDWLSEENLKLCIGRLESQLKMPFSTEVEYILEDEPELKNRKLIGHIDVIDSDGVWELKCVSQLEDEHKLQLACYMYLYLKSEDRKKRSIFFSLDDSENDFFGFEKSENGEEDSIEKLEIAKVLLQTVMDESFSEGDEIQLENGEIGWKIGKIFKTGRISVLKNGKTKKIEAYEIMQNLSQQKKIEKLQKEIRELEKKKRDTKHFYLYNVLTNEKIEIQSSLTRLKKMIEYLIYHKFFVKNFMSDEEFIQQNETIRNQIYGF